MRIFMFAIFVATVAHADAVLPQPEETHARFETTGESAVSREYEYKKRYTSEAERNAVLEAQLEASRKTFAAKVATNPDAMLKGNSSQRHKQHQIVAKRNAATEMPRLQTVPSNFGQSFVVTGRSSQKHSLPTGSFVKAKVLSGVEAGQDPLPMLLALDHSFTGPNHSEINLKHCLMVAKAKGNISNERVYGETTKISCVKENGESVERTAHGYIVGDDATFGAIGPVVSKKGQAIAAAASLSAIKGIGEAVGLTESKSQTFATGSIVEKSASITGSKTAVVLGKAGMEAASLLAQEAIEQARNFQPSVAIGSGREVWVVILEPIEIPMLQSSEESED